HRLRGFGDILPQDPAVSSRSSATRSKLTLRACVSSYRRHLSLRRKSSLSAFRHPGVVGADRWLGIAVDVESRCAAFPLAVPKSRLLAELPVSVIERPPAIALAVIEAPFDLGRSVRPVNDVGPHRDPSFGDALSALPTRSFARRELATFGRRG